MLGWVISAILVLAGFITGFFIAPDAMNFPIIQMVVGILLFTLIVIVIAFWSSIKSWFVNIIKKYR